MLLFQSARRDILSGTSYWNASDDYTEPIGRDCHFFQSSNLPFGRGYTRLTMESWQNGYPTTTIDSLCPSAESHFTCLHSLNGPCTSKRKPSRPVASSGLKYISFLFSGNACKKGRRPHSARAMQLNTVLAICDDESR